MNDLYVGYKKYLVELEQLLLKRNFQMTLLIFVLLIANLFLIKMHPFSTGYYFVLGFFFSRMLDLIFQKSDIKRLIKNSIKNINQMKGNIVQ